MDMSTRKRMKREMGEGESLNKRKGNRYDWVE